jgi:hypothetical protein
MTLPQETIDKIKAEAEIYQQHRTVTAKRGYIAGATEWAGKASGLVDALKIIEGIHPGDTNEATLSNIILARTIAANALAKYKEVTNG